MDKLNLGCGNVIVPNAVNHDVVKHRPEVNVAWDLNKLPWPWKDCSFDLIMAKAVFEHLRLNLVESANECWRILRPGGLLYLKVPFWQHEKSYDDPTHYWRYTLKSCNVFDPETWEGRTYGFYTARKWKIVKGPELNSGKSSIHVTMMKR